MSLTSPVLVPVTLFMSTDASAPVLDKTAGCIARILEACLVTGYGSKVAAGWTKTHDDPLTNTKVFNSENVYSPIVSLRVYNDTGKKLNIQLVKDVVSANAATKVIECDTEFKYIGTKTTGQWAVIASNLGFWFFAQVESSNGVTGKSGSFLFAGMVSGTQSDAFIISHTGGDYAETDDDRRGITTVESDTQATGTSTQAVAYSFTNNLTHKSWFQAFSNGLTNESPVAMASPLYFKGMGDIYRLPVYSPSRNDMFNFQNVIGSLTAMNFCTSMQARDTGNNAYVPTDNWVY